MTTLEEMLMVEHQALSEKALEQEAETAKSPPCQVVAPGVQGLEHDNRMACFVQMAAVAVNSQIPSLSPRALNISLHPRT
jgi:hypothetical protein